MLHQSTYPTHEKCAPPHKHLGGARHNLTSHRYVPVSCPVRNERQTATEPHNTGASTNPGNKSPTTRKRNKQEPRTLDSDHMRHRKQEPRTPTGKNTTQTGAYKTPGHKSRKPGASMKPGLRPYVAKQARASPKSRSSLWLWNRALKRCAIPKPQSTTSTCKRQARAFCTPNIIHLHFAPRRDRGSR